MKVLIDIPKEYILHYLNDRFIDSLRRLKADANCLAGNYEKELADMLCLAFQKSIIVNDERKSAINEKQHIFAVNKKCYECMYRKEECACLTDYCECGNDDVMFNDEDVENPCKQFERKEYDIETIPRNCKNCFYADLYGDGSAFCDEKETYVSQGGYCAKWKSFRCGDSE